MANYGEVGPSNALRARSEEGEGEAKPERPHRDILRDLGFYEARRSEAHMRMQDALSKLTGDPNMKLTQGQVRST